jgi:hypothetical protein
MYRKHRTAKLIKLFIDKGMGDDARTAEINERCRSALFCFVAGKKSGALWPPLLLGWADVCKMCNGSGKVQPFVSVEWKPAGEIQAVYKKAVK